MDYRPALVNREGIGRYTRELVRGMLELGFDANLGLFGYTLKGLCVPRAELGLEGSRAELLRLRLPSRWIPKLLARRGQGVDDLVGGCEVYHHTQPNRLPVRLARQVATIFDCIWATDALRTDGPGFVDHEVAKRMRATAQAYVKEAARVLVPTEFVGADVVMTLGVHPGKVMVTSLGCDHVVRHLPPGGFEAPAEPFILTVSRVDSRKNHVRILAAFERLVEQGLSKRWIVVGPKGYGCEHFERALRQSPARKYVTWIKNANDAAVVKLYWQAELLVWPSLAEGFGLPPLEAMACGTPVITSPLTSLPEVCGDAALYVDPLDVERIHAGMERVLTEPEFAADMRKQGLTQARKFTWRQCAKDTLLAYRAATEGDGAPVRMQGLF